VSGLGWIARDIEIIRGVRWAEFLSHTVKTRKLVLKNNLKIKLDIVSRKGERPMAKLMMSSDQKGVFNERGRQILTTKAMSFITCYWNRIDILVMSLIIAIKMAGDLSEEIQDISWLAQKVIKDMNTMVRFKNIMEVHTSIKMRVKYIIIDKKEMEEYHETIRTAIIAKDINDEEAELFMKCIREDKLYIETLVNKTFKIITTKYINRNKGMAKNPSWYIREMESRRIKRNKKQDVVEKGDMDDVLRTLQCGVCGNKVDVEDIRFNKKIHDNNIKISCDKTDCKQTIRAINKRNRDQYMIICSNREQ